MNLVKINKDIFINPDEVVSIQYEAIDRDQSLSGGMSEWWCGSIVVLKNGRKIAVRDKKPDEILELLGTDKDRNG